MSRMSLLAGLLAATMTSVGAAQADPWKDESGHGRRGGGEWKEEFRDGNCKVERKWERNGEYKEGYCQVDAEWTKLAWTQLSGRPGLLDEGTTGRIAPGEEGAITSSSVLTGRETMTVELEVVVDRGVSGEELLRMSG
jgi:hypothetical protein